MCPGGTILLLAIQEKSKHRVTLFANHVCCAPCREHMAFKVLEEIIRDVTHFFFKVTHCF